MTQCILADAESPEAPEETVQSGVSRLRMDDLSLNDGQSDEEDEGELRTGPTVWIVAQSNVAVKNVAEKLVKVGIHQFKLIVSREFHFDWQVFSNHVSRS